MGNLLTNPERTLRQRLLWRMLAEWEGWSRDRIAKLVTAEQPDVIHTHNLVGLSRSTWTVARAHNIPSVHTLHDYQLLCPAGTMFRAGKRCATQCRTCRIITFAQRRASTFPQAIVGNSAFTLKAHISAGYFRLAAHYVIPNGPPPLEESRAAGRQCAVPDPEIQASAMSTPLRLGFLGRLLPSKGVGLLLEALTHLPKHGWTAKIAGTGSPSYLSTLKEDARRRALPVSFIGWTEADSFFREIDLLVIPSIYAEPQGIGLLEAVMRNVPVVYSDLGGLGEIGAVTPGAVPFVGGSADNLARVLHRLLSCPPELTALRQDTLSPNPLCNTGRFAERYISVYQQTLRPAKVERPIKTATNSRPNPAFRGD
jgi:glycosyltransferase involved in cell wall biosynthesis